MAPAFFDRVALQIALDARRAERGLTWADVRREVNAQFAQVPGHRQMAMGTIRGTGLEADGVLQLLLWLDRSPESFMVGGADSPVLDVARRRLQRPAPNRILRADTKAMHEALDRARREHGLGWDALARELGLPGAASLTALARGGRTSIAVLAAVAGWLDVPCSTFTRAAPR